MILISIFFFFLTVNEVSGNGLHKTMEFLEHFNFVNYIYILNKAEEDIRMSKQVLQIKVCC